jgi:oligosaccharide repeat unit polymerase
MLVQRIFLSPPFIFAIIWILMLSISMLNISYSFSDEVDVLIFIATLSFLGYFLGYFSLLLFTNKYKSPIRYKNIIHKIDIKKLQGALLASVFFICSILIINFYLDGYPPFFSNLGVETKNYVEYGRMKGVLFALIVFLFLISSLFKTKTVDVLIKLFCFGVLVLYLSRGFVIFTLLSWLFFYLFENKKTISLLKLIFMITCAFIFILILMSVAGEYRTGTASFIKALEIKDSFLDLDPEILWLVSYISMPTINIVELVQYQQYFMGKATVNAMLPGFMNFDSESREFYASILPNEHNTAGTYLKNVVLDFGILGILIYNYLIGIFSYLLFKYSSSSLIKSVFLAELSLLFFADFFLFFPTLFLLFVLILFNKYAFYPINTALN